MEGRHVHPSTLYAGGIGTVPTLQLFTDYLVAADELRRVHEGLRAAARRSVRLLLRGAARATSRSASGASCSAAGARSKIPSICDFHYKNMTNWGRDDVRHARASSSTASSSRPISSRSISGSAFCSATRSTTTGTDAETFVTDDPLGNPVDRRHPWNQHTLPTPQKRDFGDKYSWVMSPRWFDGKDHLALDTGGGPLARLWSTALAGLVDFGYVKATGDECARSICRRRADAARFRFEWKIPKWSNTLERNRARTYFQAYAAAARALFLEQAFEELNAGRTQDVGAVHRAGRRRLAAVSPRRCAACSRTTW